jgi:hypothetical protein
MADVGHGVIQRARQIAGTIAIALQQLKCDSLGGLATDARHATQRLDESHQ